jgi:hypothetical protein
MHAANGGTRALCLCFLLCLDGPHNTCRQILPDRWHAAAAPVRTMLPCAPVGLASPVVAIRMRLHMHMGHAEHTSLPTCMWGPLRPRGLPPYTPTSPLLVMQHLQHKSICCNIYPKQIKHLQTYSCNICVWSLQHMQYPDKTLATYIWNSQNIWNIHLQHTCIASATYATSR